MKKVVFFSFLLTFFVACNPDDKGGLTDIPYNPTPYTLSIPSQFPQMDIPADNPMTTEGVELGRFLFYDKILSSNGTMSCASCHLPALSFTDANATSKGVDNIAGRRSSMALENVGFVTKGLFWDGRSKTLEEQALLPVEDPIELHNKWTQVIEKLKVHADYPTRFRKAFGIKNASEITKEMAAKAIAQFERTLISGNAKVDKIFRREAEFTDDEYSGYLLFFNAAGAPDAQCGHCHTTPFYNSNDFFNNGLDSVANLADFKDLGRGVITKRSLDNGKFRAPSLRNIELTAPYMHDGRFKTLEEVVEHYASGGHYAENIDPFIPQIKDIRLTTKQKRQIVLFLKTLTDTSFVNNPAFKDPFN
ncbi:MAG: cytochrome C peroxidase [Saprospiraceae bacterium]|nr:cytochrome C peroxidase [Saprospiraceae bacterium]